MLRMSGNTILPFPTAWVGVEYNKWCESMHTKLSSCGGLKLGGLTTSENREVIHPDLFRFLPKALF